MSRKRKIVVEEDTLKRLNILMDKLRNEQEGEKDKRITYNYVISYLLDYDF